MLKGKQNTTPLCGALKDAIKSPKGEEHFKWKEKE